MPDAAATRAPREAVVQRTSRIRRSVWWLGLGATSLVAASLSLIAYDEGLPFENVLPQLDKAVHFGIGGSLAFFLDGVLRRRTVFVGSIPIPLAAPLILVPAGFEEYLQRFSANRSSSFGDFAADVAGVAFSIWLSRRLG